MKRLLVLLLALSLAGCASITYQTKDGTLVTIKDYTFAINQPNGLQVTGTPSRMINNVDLGDIITQIGAIIPKTPIVTPAPAPNNPIPVPVPTPTPTSPVVPPQPQPTPVPVTGTISVIDMATLPDEVNATFGQSIAAGDIYYAVATTYAGLSWSPNTGYDGSVWLYNNQDKLTAWVDGKVQKASDALKANPGLQATAIVNDACDRLGGRLGAPVVTKLQEFGNRVTGGRWITEADCLGFKKMIRK